MMAPRLAAEGMTAAEQEERDFEFAVNPGPDQHARPTVTHSQSDPIPDIYEHPEVEVPGDDTLSGESRDVVGQATLSTLPRALNTLSSDRRKSGSTIGESSTQSRPSSPYASLATSATTPSIYTEDSFTSYSAASSRRRPSTISRLRASINTGLSKHIVHRPLVKPVDFRIKPAQPEKRFVDAIGMIFPGVCDRQQCNRPLAHFVTSFRLCEPIEYTTALADHGITYADYCRLVVALLNFLEEISERPGTASSKASATVESDEERSLSMSLPQRTKNTLFDTTEQFKKSKHQAPVLNKLLEDITWNLQARGVPVMVCVHSFSLFAPSRISEAHIQVLHVSRNESLQGTLASQKSTATDGSAGRLEQRISFIDVFSFAQAEQKPSRPKLERQAVSATATMTTTQTIGTRPAYHHQKSQLRDHSRPYPLWPNAIPSNKRHLLYPTIDRYGADPYFRAWMRANINSKTRSSTYTKYLIEQENDPFVNKRLKYIDTDSRRGPVDFLVQELSPSTLNRSKYDHNRRLECRKTTEHGSRVRILRFGFRHPIYPPHTPEMEMLGLGKNTYQSIISNIDSFHTKVQLNTRCPGMYMVASLNKVRRRSTEDALTRVSDYLRQLNASQRRIVWTIEKIPGVYDKGFARNRTEWEISAWNAEDPLELLIQLEKWGIIEKRLSVDD
jgi:hypothetical protein